MVPTAAMDAEVDPEFPFRPRSILAATCVVGALRPVVGLVTELVACLVTAPVLALKEGATEAMVGVGATGLPIRPCSTLNVVLPRPVVPPELEEVVSAALPGLVVRELAVLATDFLGSRLSGAEAAMELSGDVTAA